MRGKTGLESVDVERGTLCMGAVSASLADETGGTDASCELCQDEVTTGDAEKSSRPLTTQFR